MLPAIIIIAGDNPTKANTYKILFFMFISFNILYTYTLNIVAYINDNIWRFSKPVSNGISAYNNVWNSKKAADIIWNYGGLKKHQ